MECLLDLYIAREIGPEEYQRKKARLLNDKLVLKERLSEIEKGGGGWLEPAKTFLTTCNDAHFTAWQENPPAQKAFLENLGSNFVLKDRTLSFSYASPFHLVAQSDPQKNCLLSIHFEPVGNTAPPRPLSPVLSPVKNEPR
jgi:hypothetical protein